MLRRWAVVWTTRQNRRRGLGEAAGAPTTIVIGALSLRGVSCVTIHNTMICREATGCVEAAAPVTTTTNCTTPAQICLRSVGEDWDGVGW